MQVRICMKKNFFLEMCARTVRENYFLLYIARIALESPLSSDMHPHPNEAARSVRPLRSHLHKCPYISHFTLRNVF